MQTTSYRSDEGVSAPVDVEYADNPSTQIPWVVVVDVSTLNGKQDIERINKVLWELQGFLRWEVYKGAVRLKIISAGGTIEDLVRWTSRPDFYPPSVKMHGRSQLGPAVEYALDELEAQKQEMDKEGIPRRRAVLTIISGGRYNDDAWGAAADRCRSLEDTSRLFVVPISVENGEGPVNIEEDRFMFDLNSGKYGLAYFSAEKRLFFFQDGLWPELFSQIFPEF